MINYYYDGTFEGLMCCIFRVYQYKEMPCAVLTAESEQTMLGSCVEIKTDYSLSDRVIKGISEKIGRNVPLFLEKAFLSCREDKELLIIKFTVIGFKVGGAVCSMLGNDVVSEITSAVRSVGNEAHLYLGFVRFSEYSGVLVSAIEPQNSVVPLIADHFCDRFRSEKFVIFDKKHHLALFHEPGHTQLTEIDEIELDTPDESELKFRRLWKTFFDTIEIKERHNYICQRSHIPLHFRKGMTEFEEITKPVSDE